MKFRITPVKGESPARRLQVQSTYYRQARYFEITADILNENAIAKSINVPQGFHTNVPVVVNHAFSLELYLKCLLQIENKLARGHLLDALFGALLPDHRLRIEQAYEKSFGPPRVGMKLADIVKRCSDAFVEWRYLNEGKYNIASGVYDAALVLPPVRQIICEDVPALKMILPLLPNQR